MATSSSAQGFSGAPVNYIPVTLSSVGCLALTVVMAFDVLGKSQDEILFDTEVFQKEAREDLRAQAYAAAQASGEGDEE